MRLLLIGTVQFSQRVLAHLLAGGTTVAGVITAPATGKNSDHADLTPICRARGIPCLVATDANAPAALAFARGCAPDVGLCVGWSQLIGRELRAVPRLGIIGYHPALLPRHRGRHPLIWALALGLRETGSTFFFLDDGADSGDIVSQQTVPIGDDDDAGTLYARITAIALTQLDEFLPQLAAGTLVRRPQDHAQASYWRKRTAADGQIDWRMPARGIVNLVRALASPYPGATCRVGGRDYRIDRAWLAPGSAPAGTEPGRVLAVGPDGIVIQTGDGLVRLPAGSLPHEITTGACL